MGWAASIANGRLWIGSIVQVNMWGVVTPPVLLPVCIPRGRHPVLPPVYLPMGW